MQRRHNHHIILLIPTSLREGVTGTVRTTVTAPTIRRERVAAGGEGEAMRKIVTAKDFEFSPRKESAAEPAPFLSPSHVHALCMHGGVARKMSWQPRNAGWLPRLSAALSPLSLSRGCTGVHIREGGRIPDARLRLCRRALLR
jgi:hypothetical protein